MHLPEAQRVPARPVPGEEYGESKNTTESDWFARGFCHDSDADRNLEHSRDYRRVSPESSSRVLSSLSPSWHPAGGERREVLRCAPFAESLRAGRMTAKNERNGYRAGGTPALRRSEEHRQDCLCHKVKGKSRDRSGCATRSKAKAHRQDCLCYPEACATRRYAVLERRTEFTNRA
jgi:hypothetical protein